MHRFFHTLLGGHFFTTSTVEYQYILDNLPVYRYEGIKFYVMPQQQAGSAGVHRFFHTRLGGHFFTTSTVEYQYILDNLPVYRYEGIKFYVY